MSCELIKLYKGSDKNLTITARSEKTFDPLDLTLASEIVACFKNDDGSQFHTLYLSRTGDTTSASDLISNIVTDDISEGMEIEGAGIPAGSTVLKTPTSTVSPTAAGTIQISANATATATGVALSVGNVKIIDATIGKIKIKLKKAETSGFKKNPKASIGLTYIIDGFTSKAQATEVLNILDDPCA